MSAKELLQEFAQALREIADAEEDGQIAVWSRQAVFELDEPAEDIWEGMPCEDAPPKAYLLMRRYLEDDVYYELWWPNRSKDDKWPVVEVSEAGDAQVIAGSAGDYIDALLATAGAMGGGNEDEMAEASEEATNEAHTLADDILDALDREPSGVARLSDKSEAAQEKYGDDWMDAVEGI